MNTFIILRKCFKGNPIRVSLEVSGLSEDGGFFEFTHNFYDHKGRNLAHCEILGAWINLKTRQLTAFPKELEAVINELPKAKNFRILTKEDTRKYGKKPIDLT